MGHGTVYGQTGMGKSSYLRHVAIPRLGDRDGGGPLLYDPFNEAWPEGVEATTDRERFHRSAWASEDRLVIHDEVSEIGKNDKALEKLAVQGRHLGHLCIFAAQRPQLVSTTVRGQCVWMVTFHLTPKDSKFLVEEWGCRPLKPLPGNNEADTEGAAEEITALATLEYIMYDQYGRGIKGKIKFPRTKE